MIKNHFSLAIYHRRQKGQVMLLSVLIMAGVMAVAMAVSWVVFDEIRLARQVPDSVRALAAASTGVECAFWRYFVEKKECGMVCDSRQIQMTSGTEFSSVISCGAATSTRAVGVSAGIRRSLEADMP